jgi:hypothetical protein
VTKRAAARTAAALFDVRSAADQGAAQKMTVVPVTQLAPVARSLLPTTMDGPKAVDAVQ